MSSSPFPPPSPPRAQTQVRANNAATTHSPWPADGLEPLAGRTRATTETTMEDEDDSG